MSAPLKLSLLVAAVGLTLACDPPETPEPVPDPPEPSFDSPPDPTDPKLEERYDPSRVVGRLVEPGVCPQSDVANWRVEPMFPGARGELARYCLYENDDDSNRRSPFPGLEPGIVGVSLPSVGLDLVFDRLVLAPQADTTDMVAKFRSRFGAEAGAPDWAVAPTELRARPRLTLIDSSPELGPPPGSPNIFDTPGAGDHGFLLGHLARELGCAGGLEDRCLFDLHARPALRYGSPPWMVGDPGDPVEAVAGSWGTIGMLAQAVWEELRLWETSERDEPLILNLSIAWHPFFDGGIPGGIEVREEGGEVDARNGEKLTWRYQAVSPSAWAKDVHAVWDVLAEARCRGALVIAAAGNRTGGLTGEDGPMLPAGWGAMPLGMLPPCEEDDAAADWQAAPLVHAVSGLEAGGRDLSVNRPFSRAPLMAFGDHAVSGRGINFGDDPITGTSVSALVVSSTAALLWAEQPTLTGREVMQRIWDVATPVGDTSGPFRDLEADVLGVPGTESDMARQVRLCEVLDAQGVAAWPCENNGAVVVDLPPIVAGEGIEQVGALGKTLPLPTCGIDHSARYSLDQLWPDTTELCPDKQHYSPAIVPWTYPQPQGTQCPFCFVDLSAGRLYLEMELPLDFFDAITVTLTTDVEQQLHYTLPGGLMTSDKVLDLSFDAGGLPANVANARLTLVKNATSKTTGLTLKP